MDKTELYARDLSNVAFHKSRRSENETDMCVEVAVLPDGARAVRDSKISGGPDLRFTPGEWAAFTDGVRNGEF